MPVGGARGNMAALYVTFTVARIRLKLDQWLARAAPNARRRNGPFSKTVFERTRITSMCFSVLCTIFFIISSFFCMDIGGSGSRRKFFFVDSVID